LGKDQLKVGKRITLKAALFQQSEYTEPNFSNLASNWEMKNETSKNIRCNIFLSTAKRKTSDVNLFVWSTSKIMVEHFNLSMGCFESPWLHQRG
jgi:hypothetical protein